MKTFNHKRLGPCKVLIEAESQTSPSRFFALIETKNKPKRDRYEEIKFTRMNSFIRELSSQYYLLWGNSPELNSMGITHLVTPIQGVSVTPGKAMEIFMSAVQNTDSVKFEQNFHQR